MKAVKICPICNKEFVPINRQKYCSIQCRQKALYQSRKEYSKQYYLAHKEKIKSYVPHEKETLVKVCPVCGKPFTTTDRRRVFCSIECRNQKQKTDVSKANESRKIEHTKICAYCGRPFKTTDSKKKYCCNECFEAASIKNAKERIRKTRNKETHNKNALKYFDRVSALGMSMSEFKELQKSGADVKPLLIQKGLQEAIKTCKKCGKEFISFDSKRKYCDDCRVKKG